MKKDSVCLYMDCVMVVTALLWSDLYIMPRFLQTLKAQIRLVQVTLDSPSSVLSGPGFSGFQSLIKLPLHYSSRSSLIEIYWALFCFLVSLRV